MAYGIDDGRPTYARQFGVVGGSSKSWVCTASGTPGTWVSEGNL